MFFIAFRSENAQRRAYRFALPRRAKTVDFNFKSAPLAGAFFMTEIKGGLCVDMMVGLGV